MSPIQPQLILMVPAGSFVRHRSYGYASSQELSTGTHQYGFRLTNTRNVMGLEIDEAF